MNIDNNLLLSKIQKIIDMLRELLGKINIIAILGVIVPIFFGIVALVQNNDTGRILQKISEDNENFYSTQIKKTPRSYRFYDKHVDNYYHNLGTNPKKVCLTSNKAIKQLMPLVAKLKAHSVEIKDLVNLFTGLQAYVEADSLFVELCESMVKLQEYPVNKIFLLGDYLDKSDLSDCYDIKDCYIRLRKEYQILISENPTLSGKSLRIVLRHTRRLIKNISRQLKYMSELTVGFSSVIEQEMDCCETYFKYKSE